jgi:hypothetical protein
VGLWVNTSLADSGQPARIAPGGGVDCLVNIFETLAKVLQVSNVSFIDFFQQERKTLPLGLTLVFVLADLEEKMQETLIDLKESGYKILVFQMGKMDGSKTVAGIPWYHIEKPEDLNHAALGE